MVRRSRTVPTSPPRKVVRRSSTRRWTPGTGAAKTGRCQDRAHRPHSRVGRRRSRPGHQGQRHRPDCDYPHVGLLHQRRGQAGRRLDDLVGQYIQKLDLARVAPVVAFLAHQDSPLSGEIYTVGAGHVARFFIDRTKGFYNPALSVEDVRDHLTRSTTTPNTPCPADPPTRWVSCSERS